MPELPEVETIVRELREENLIGTKITEIFIYWPGVTKPLSSTDFQKKIKNQVIQNVSRRGKYIVIELVNWVLLIHLRMTGKISLSKISTPSPHEHLILGLSNGLYLHYKDTRKFGRWTLSENKMDALKHLGIEPLSKEFTCSHFEALVKAHKTKLKPFLLNQSYIAGIGNIYADEALWMAKLHPLRTTEALSKVEIKNLHHAIQAVLESGIKNRGTSLGSGKPNYLTLKGTQGGNQHGLEVFRREGEPCRRCGTTIIKMVVAQRGTHLCPNCQKN